MSICHQFRWVAHHRQKTLLYPEHLFTISYLEQRSLFRWGFDVGRVGAGLAPCFRGRVGLARLTHPASRTGIPRLLARHSLIFQLKCDYLNIAASVIAVRLYSPLEQFSDRYLHFFA